MLAKYLAENTRISHHARFRLEVEGEYKAQTRLDLTGNVAGREGQQTAEGRFGEDGE